MVKPLPAFVLDRTRLKKELRAFAEFLGEPTKELREQEDILPFFKANPQLSALLGSAFHSEMGEPDLLKHEYDFAGCHGGDLAAGNSARGAFCFVEFEDAKPGSVFKPARKGRLPEWSARLEHGHSQIVDWFFTLEGLKHSDLFRSAFGSSLASYLGVLVVGRRTFLDERMQARLRWRSLNTLVAGKSVLAMTFDDLRNRMEERAKGMV